MACQYPARRDRPRVQGMASLTQRLQARLNSSSKQPPRVQLNRAQTSIRALYDKGYTCRAIFDALVREGTITSCTYRTFCRYVAEHVRDPRV